MHAFETHLNALGDTRGTRRYATLMCASRLQVLLLASIYADMRSLYIQGSAIVIRVCRDQDTGQ